MAVKKRGLGKGLDTLIPDKSKSVKSPAPAGISEKVPAAGASAERGESIIQLSLSRVEPNRNQPRKKFDEKAIGELADSIKEHGVITPILVQKEDGYYQIIAGERRWRAARKAGLKKIPAIVKNYEEAEKLAVSLIENIQREDLDVIEEAQAYKRLVDDYSLTQQEVAARVSKSREAVANIMRLLNLDERVQAMMAEGSISMGHGRALLKIHSGARQYQLAQEIAEKQLSVREVEKITKQETSGGKKPARRKAKKADDPYMRDMEERMSTAVGTKVSIKPSSREKGRIEIEYYSGDELDRLFELIRHIEQK